MTEPEGAIIDRAFRDFCTKHQISCVAVFAKLVPLPGGGEIKSGCGIYIGRDVISQPGIRALKGTLDALGSGLADVCDRLAGASNELLKAEQKNDGRPNRKVDYP